MSFFQSFFGSFAHGGLLWFLPLALLPVLLHLLTLLRLRTVELSTYRFLFDSYVQQRRRMQLLEFLLALLRTAFLLFLVFALAKPVIRHWGDLFQTGGGAGGREVVLLVDCSASMNAQTAGVPAMDRAKIAARAVVKQLRPEDRVTLIRVSSRPEEMFTRFSSDVENIGEKIDNLSTTPSRANFYSAFLQLFGPEAPPRPQPLVYVFTDCQSSGWDEVRDQGLEKLIPEGTQVVVVNVGSHDELPNQAVIGYPPRRSRAVVGLPVYLNAHVANFSNKPVTVTLKTIVGEKEIARQKVELKAGQKLPRRVVYVPTEPGNYRGRFEISDNTEDRFPNDDKYLFTLNVIPRVKVLVINGNPSQDPDLNEALYLRTIGDIFSGKGDENKPEKPGGLREIARSIDIQEVPEVGLSSPDVLKEVSVVVLANCGSLNPTHFGLLRDFVAAGGGLLVFPGDKVNPDQYNSLFFGVPNSDGDYLTPARLGAQEPPANEPDKEENRERLSALDYSHPVLSVFDDRKREVPYFQGVRIYRRFPITLPDKGGKAWPLAGLSSGKHALVESKYGDGMVIVAAFPLNRKWSNLPTEHGPEFVPLMLRLLSYAQHRPEVEAPLSVSPGGVVEITATGAWNPVVCKVTDPGGRTTPVTLERSGSRMVGAFDRTTTWGYQSIEVHPEHLEVNKGATQEFAVNLAPEESNFAMLNGEKLEELLPGASVRFVDASAEAQQERSLNDKLEETRPIWKYLIYAMFLIIGVEFMLATMGGRRTAVEEHVTVAERIRNLSPGTWIGRMTGAGRKEAD